VFFSNKLAIFWNGIYHAFFPKKKESFAGDISTVAGIQIYPWLD
jgi:hypothetical protein